MVGGLTLEATWENLPTWTTIMECFVWMGSRPSGDVQTPPTWQEGNQQHLQTIATA